MRDRRKVFDRQIAKLVVGGVFVEAARGRHGLGADRLENELGDKKPLLAANEARAEAERCLYCADAPCIKACPTEIDIPTFIRKRQNFELGSDEPKK